jgi:GNAT superfamily N-acetyltransferase
VIEIRWSTAEDAETLARLRAASWRNAYAGILTRPAIEQMISYRGAAYWRRTSVAGRALVITLDETVLGYALMGFDRRATGAELRDTGEIFEIYLAPEAQGVGLGRKLFQAARAELRAAGLRRLRVWALGENEIGCRFYRALGGEEWSRGFERIGDRDIEKIGFRWVT